MRQALQHFSEISLTVTGMILFLTVYMAVVVRVFLRHKAQDFNQVAALPLHTEEEQK